MRLWTGKRDKGDATTIDTPGPTDPKPTAAKAGDGQPAPAGPKAPGGPAGPSVPTGAGTKEAKPVSAAAPASKAGKLEFEDKVRAKARETQHRGPGRPPKELEPSVPEVPTKPPMTPEEIQESAGAIVDLRMDVMTGVFGPAWKDGAYGQKDKEGLKKGYVAPVEKFQIRLPWWLTWFRAELNYNTPRFRDPKNFDSMREFLGLKKKPIEIKVNQVVDKKP